MVERDRPVRERTVLRRMIRSGSDIARLRFTGCGWHLVGQTGRTNTGRKQICPLTRLRRGNGGKSGGSDPDAASSANAVAEREFRAEAAARSGVNAEITLAVGKHGFKLRIAFKALGHIGHGRTR